MWGETNTLEEVLVDIKQFSLPKLLKRLSVIVFIFTSMALIQFIFGFSPPLFNPFAMLFIMVASLVVLITGRATEK